MLTTEAAIIGVGETPYTRHAPEGATTHTFIRDAARMAIADAGLTIGDIDGFGVVSFSMEPDKAIDMAWRLGLSVRWLMQDTNGGSSGINMLGHAKRGIEAGAARNILIVGGDYMGLQGVARLSANYNRAIRDHVAPLGHSGPNSLFSLQTQRQMKRHGLRREDYGHLAVAQRAWAMHNPNAVYRTPLTLDDYLSAPFVTEPLTRFDCVPAVAGATACVIGTVDGCPATHAPVRVRALRQSFNHDHQAGDGLVTGLRALAGDLWSAAGLTPADMDLASIYDDYPSMVLAQLDDLGMIEGGDLPRYCREVLANRRFPVNTSGGLLSAGQAGAAGGLNGLIEAVRQLQHRADGRQVPDARHAVVSGYGMVLYRYGANVGAAVLERVQ